MYAPAPPPMAGYFAPPYGAPAPPYGGPPFGGSPYGAWEPPPQVWGSQEAYVETMLRHQDVEGYKSAGLLCYRKKDNSMDFLMCLEKPWNSLAETYDPVAWNILGGKRGGGKSKEWDPTVTAARCIVDALGGTEELPSMQDFQLMCGRSPVLYYPRGKFALFLCELTATEEENLRDVPNRYSQARAKGAVASSGEGEQRPNMWGEMTTKWIKQIEELEWVNVADLTSKETRKPMTNLLENVCYVEAFQRFLEEGVLPPGPAPGAVAKGGMMPTGQPSFDKGAKGGCKGGSRKGGKDGGKNRGKKGGGGYRGGGKVGSPFDGALMVPMGAPMVPQQSPEVHKQMLGEKLYVLVQPMVQKDIVAQKITGMLLELPLAELMGLLGSAPEERQLLKERVDEAMEVLAQDGDPALES